MAVTISHFKGQRCFLALFDSLPGLLLEFRASQRTLVNLIRVQSLYSVVRKSDSVFVSYRQPRFLPLRTCLLFRYSITSSGF